MTKEPGDRKRRKAPTAVNSIADGLLWTHLDQLGTPRLKTDSTGGTVVRMGWQPGLQKARPSLP